ncbi:MAG: urea ABC transporter permease subunit UrtB, partial [Gammaproteobacteria bacterium]
LSESLNPSALNALDSYAAPNQALEKQTRMAIRKINEQRDLYAKAETIFFGLSLGSVLALAAIGLAITFGVMGVINMAHGELMMIGAYTTYVIQQLMPGYIGASIIVAIPAAFIVSGLVGIAIERGVIRHLYGRPLETLLATFGISLILQQVVRSIFSPLNRSVETPQWMSGAWQFNEVFALTWNRFYIIIFSVAVFVALIMVMKKTTLGLQVRAVSQNRTMARAMGVRSEWVDALTFGLGSGIAGMAGVALSLLTNVGPNLGQSYIIDSFMVVVFGGVGNLWGTLIAGMSLGVINKALEPWAGAVLAKILVLVFIILFIQKRPKGLFPQRGRAAED